MYHMPYRRSLPLDQELPAIFSPRLSLVSLSPACLAACLEGDAAEASRLLGVAIPPEFLAERWLLELRLGDLRADPSWQPWLLRAVVLRATGEMIGHIGFHTPPAPDYLDALAPGGIEMGYTIYPAHQRQGYATEAASALMAWAEQRGQRRFVLSISPGNEPSQRIARRLGFAKVGEQVDEIDGVEEVLVRDVGGAAQG
ncbi:GNAT family N-acetyltransferase [Chloroflexia bacterium SDU3-3]|nr:GNAT family N-acetyltransferase [Chloroflexia bacterium SDU3-3]